MSSRSLPPGLLSDLQLKVLRAFVQVESGFYLTGGAALAGFYLGHRETSDLDLFTPSAQAFERGRFALAAVAESLGAEMSTVQDAPGFQRHLVVPQGDALVVDLVLERGPRADIDRPTVEGIVLDPIEEILANKLTTLVGRAEPRDLVDVFCLEQAGYPVESALATALQKDGGCTPATLAWLLAEIRVRDDTVLPAGVSVQALRTWLSGLVDRLVRCAAPPPG